MNKKLITLTICLFIATLSVGQTNVIPSIDIKTLDGKVFNTNDFDNDGKPMIISFWATWCKPCITELNAINDIYEDMQEETGVVLIAISIDDARTMSKVNPFINGRGWEYDVYIDSNHDMKRAMNVNMVPHTFLVNGKKEIIKQHTSFAPGDEYKLFDYVKKTALGESLD